MIYGEITQLRERAMVKDSHSDMLSDGPERIKYGEASSSLHFERYFLIQACSLIDRSKCEEKTRLCSFRVISSMLDDSEACEIILPTNGEQIG